MIKNDFICEICGHSRRNHDRDKGWACMFSICACRQFKPPGAGKAAAERNRILSELYATEQVGGGGEV